SRRRHTRFSRDWSSDVCSSDLNLTRCAEVTVATPTTVGVLYPGHAAEDDYPLLAERLGPGVALPLVHTTEHDVAHTVDDLLAVEIGRASCRERVQSAVVGGGLR